LIQLRNLYWQCLHVAVHLMPVSRLVSPRYVDNKRSPSSPGPETDFYVDSEFMIFAES